MIKVETNSLYHYEVTGEREQEAAQELEKKLDFIYRDYYSPYTAQDISEARQDVAKKYGVEVKAVI